MRILVTGGAGFLGTHLVDRLVAEGHEVTILDRVLPNRSDVPCIQSDASVTSSSMYPIVVQSEVIYHLAGASNIDTIKTDPIGAVWDTVLSTANLLDICRKAKGFKRFIFVSSVYAYGKEGHLYTSTKRCAEELCRDFHTLYGVPYTVLRYGPFYGEGGRRGIIGIFVRKALAGEPLVIHGDGKQSRHFIYVGDAVEAGLRVLERDIDDRFGVVMGATAITMEDLARTVAREVGNECVISYDKAREDAYYEDDDRAVQASLRTQKILGWEPKVGIEEGIRRTVAWYREQMR